MMYIVGVDVSVDIYNMYRDLDMHASRDANKSIYFKTHLYVKILDFVA